MLEIFKNPSWRWKA